METIITLNDNLQREEVIEVRSKDKITWYEYANHKVLRGPKLAVQYLENGEYYPTEYGELRFWGGIQEVKAN